MKEDDINTTFQSNLESILQDGARKLLQQAIENEVNEYVNQHKNQRHEDGRQIIKRNGYLPQREIQTGIGLLPIKKPRIRGDQFTSAILPKYMRRIPSIDALIPALYLKGVSTNGMEEALSAILGDHATGLSSSNIAHLKKIWEEEYASWCKRDLTDKHYVYFWADGIYFNVRLSDDRPCLLIIIGALENGKKEIVAIHDGIRESTLSWKTVLQDLKARGLQCPPELGIGDGGLGFWAALAEEFPATRHQRCWVHKTANVLDKLPKSVQIDAKSMIHEMYLSPTKEEGQKALKRFCSLYQDKYPKACHCIVKDEERLFTFYDFPAKHWQHLRTTNPIESTFATIRHRSRQTKGCGSRRATLSMVYKLIITAEKHWIRLRGYELIQKLIAGVKFKDGEEIKKVA